MENRSKYTKGSSRAFLSFDTLLSLLAILLIVVYTINTHSYMVKRASLNIEKQIVFDKLVSIADYIVENKGAKKEVDSFDKTRSIIYPNWIVEEELQKIDQKQIAEQVGLKELTIGFESAEGNCIYRLVIYEDKKEIKKLYVCGA